MDHTPEKRDKFIKHGEIFYDREARTAKAECDANEVIEEIQMERQRADQECPNFRIIDELVRAFANGPLSWKPCQTQDSLACCDVTKQTTKRASLQKFDGYISLKDKEAHFTFASAEAEGKAKLVIGKKDKHVSKGKAEVLAKAGVVAAQGKVCLKVKIKPDGSIYVPGAELELGKAHVGAEATLSLKSKALGAEIKLRAAAKADAALMSAKVGKVKLEEYNNTGEEIKAQLQVKGLDLKAGNVHMAKEKYGAKAEASAKVTGLEVNAGNVSVVGQDNSVTASATAEAGVKVTAGNVAVVGLGPTGSSVQAEATTGIQVGNIQVGIKRRTGASFSTQPQVGNVDFTVGPPTLNMGCAGALNIGIPFLGGGTGGVGDQGSGEIDGCITGSDSTAGTVHGLPGGTSSEEGTTGAGLLGAQFDTGEHNGDSDSNHLSEYGQGSQYGDALNGNASGSCSGQVSMDGQLLENVTVDAAGAFVRSDSDALIVLDTASDADMEHIAQILQENSLKSESSVQPDTTFHFARNSQWEQNGIPGNSDEEYSRLVHVDSDEEFDVDFEDGSENNKRKKTTSKQPLQQANGISRYDSYRQAQQDTRNVNKQPKPLGSEMSSSSVTKGNKTGHEDAYKPEVFRNGSVLKTPRHSTQPLRNIPLLPNRIQVSNNGQNTASSDSPGGKDGKYSTHVASTRQPSGRDQWGKAVSPYGDQKRYLNTPRSGASRNKPNQKDGVSPVTSGLRPSSKQSRFNSRTDPLPPISDTNGITRPQTANYNELIRKKIVQAVNPDIPISKDLKPIPRDYDRDRLKHELLSAYLPPDTKKGSSKLNQGGSGGIGRVGGTGFGNGDDIEKPKRRKEKQKPSGSNKNIHTIFTIDGSEDGKPIIDYGNFCGFGDD